MTITEDVRRRVAASATNRCGYCRISAQFIYALMEIDYLLPIAKGGSDDEKNLWLACPRCNNYKRDEVSGTDPESQAVVMLYNPRRQRWWEHFRWNPDDLALIVGIIPQGKATIDTLKLNNPANLAFRRLLVEAGWYLPSDDSVKSG